MNPLRKIISLYNLFVRIAYKAPKESLSVKSAAFIIFALKKLSYEL